MVYYYSGDNMNYTPRETKKREKFQSLMRAACDLFFEQGFARTTVDDIAKRANVAKGTFYLYFKDKGDVMQSVEFILFCRILESACKATAESRSGSFCDDFILIMDYLLDYLAENKILLQLVGRSFEWPSSAQAIEDEDLPNLKSFLTGIAYSKEFINKDINEIYVQLYTATQMCTSLCYSSVLHSQPLCLAELKPYIFANIRRILQ